MADTLNEIQRRIKHGKYKHLRFRDELQFSKIHLDDQVLGLFTFGRLILIA